jgi:hypothetical protein
MVAATGSVDPMPTRSYKWDAKEGMYAIFLGMLLYIKQVMRGLLLCIKRTVLNAIVQFFALGVFAHNLYLITLLPCTQETTSAFALYIKISLFWLLLSFVCNHADPESATAQINKISSVFKACKKIACIIIELPWGVLDRTWKVMINMPGQFIGSLLCRTFTQQHAYLSKSREDGWGSVGKLACIFLYILTGYAQVFHEQSSTAITAMHTSENSTLGHMPHTQKSSDPAQYLSLFCSALVLASFMCYVEKRRGYFKRSLLALILHAELTRSLTLASTCFCLYVDAIPSALGHAILLLILANWAYKAALVLYLASLSQHSMPEMLSASPWRLSLKIISHQCITNVLYITERTNNVATAATYIMLVPVLTFVFGSSLRVPKRAMSSVHRKETKLIKTHRTVFYSDIEIFLDLALGVNPECRVHYRSNEAGEVRHMRKSKACSLSSSLINNQNHSRNPQHIAL